MPQLKGINKSNYRLETHYKGRKLLYEILENNILFNDMFNKAYYNLFTENVNCVIVFDGKQRCFKLEK